MKKNLKTFEKLQSQLDLPYLETDNKFIKEIFQTLELEFGLESNSKQKFIDLGSGNGNVVIYAVLNYNIKSYGIEINQTLIKEAKIKIESLKNKAIYHRKLLNNIKIKWGDFYLLNLNEYNFIYIYSLPSMQKYLKHVFNTIRKNAIIISHKYRLEDFDSIIKDEYSLIHKNEKPEIFTFFYRKFV